MMKIGIDIRELQKGKATGIGRYLLDFLKFIAENKHEWEFVLFGNQNTEIKLDAPNIKKIIIPEHFRPFWDQLQLPFYLNEEKVDVFLTPYFKAPLFISCKLLLIINDLMPIAFAGYHRLKTLHKRIYFASLAKHAAVRANKIITISQYSKQDILRLFNVPVNRVEVVYLGVDKRYHPHKPDAQVISSKYGINRSFILYFGNFKPHKNVKTLIEAYSGLCKETKSQYQLVLGGKKDKYCLELERLIGQLELEQNVIFTGSIPEEDLPLIYSAASLFVFPSFYEGFGLPPLEAMACGVPVIASKATSLPEVVGDAGILVNPDDANAIKTAITNILGDSALRNSLITKGLEKASQFETCKTAEKILKVLEEI